MDITLDKKSSTEALIKITLKETDYQPTVEEKVKEYARKASIKGFRPGKVPPGLIRKMYGKSILVEEVNRLLSESVNSYIKDNKLNLIGEPLPNIEKAEQVDWDTQKEFEFDYEIGMVDEFKYDLSDKVKLTNYLIDLDKKTLDETLDNIKAQFGKQVNPEKAEDGDDFMGTLSNEEVSNEGIIKFDYLSKAGQKKMLAAKPGKEVKLNIEKDFADAHAVSHALNISEEEASELKGSFTFALDKINHMEPAELNQELFDSVFGKDTVKDEKEFIAKVKETVEGNYNRETGYFLNRNIQEELVKKTKIEIPEEFLKHWLLRTNEGKITEEDVDREIGDYIESMKWDLIKNKIAEDNEINVEHEDVVDRAKSMILEQLGGPGAAEQLKDHMDAFADNYLKAENGQNYMRLYQELRDDKIFELARDKATIKDKKVSVDEFKKIVEKANK